MSRTYATDDSEQNVLDNIARYGWHCVHVLGEGEHRAFSYTVGLDQSYGYPELLIYGLPRDTSHAVLAIAAEKAAQHQPIDVTRPTDELLEGYPCVFVEIPKDEYPEHVGFARWFYEGDSFPVQQIVWPSRGGFFPWHEEAPDSFKKAQPVLGQYENGA
jgi:hypothetical protein